MYFQGYGVTRMGEEIRLQGITPQPNALGPLTVMGIILLFYNKRNNKISFYITFLILIITLIVTRSRTSYAAFIIFIALYFAVKKREYRFWIISGLSFLFLIIYISIGYLGITEFWGRNLTFTGRTNIWLLTIQDWMTHPILGTGFGASFVPVHGSLFETTLKHMNWATVHSHQEVLQLFNELGLIFAPIIILIISMGIPYGAKITTYICIPLLIYISFGTLLFEGTIFSVMLFLIYLHGPLLVKRSKLFNINPNT
jgi:hypothetical protein